MNFDYRKIVEKGGGVYGDDDFEIVKCSNCGYQYLYNDETLELYFDPNNLTERELNAVGYCPPCKSCGKEDWDFETIEINSAEILSSAWVDILKK